MKTTAIMAALIGIFSLHAVALPVEIQRDTNVYRIDGIPGEIEERDTNVYRIDGIPGEIEERDTNVYKVDGIPGEIEERAAVIGAGEKRANLYLSADTPVGAVSRPVFDTDA